MTTASLTRMTAPSLLTDLQVYRLLFAATFAIFLAAVLLKRVGRLLGFGASAPGRSILADAREMGASTLLFAFMG